jgi:hypothetical protein
MLVTCRHSDKTYFMKSYNCTAITVKTDLFDKLYDAQSTD